MMRKLPWIMLLCAALASGCARKEEEKAGVGKPPMGTLITTATAERKMVEVTQEAVGQVDAENAPTIAAETPGRVVQVYVDVGDAVQAGQVLAEIDPGDQKIDREAAAAEVARLKALLVNQQFVHERNRQLREQGFISQAALDNSEAQLTSTREQLNAAQARLDISTRNLTKTRILAPLAGHIDMRRITVGDYVKVGDPLLRIAANQSLLVRLPFPEVAAAQVRIGQTVHLMSPLAPRAPVTARIDEIRPMVGTTSRAIEAIVKLANPGGWAAGASVNGSVVIAQRESLTVPEASIVQRPAGEVVYLVRDGKAYQQPVKVGVRRQGYAEILSGLSGGETIALDGAGFLTDQAAVTLPQAKTETAKTN
ncbi:MAG: efflux RND transporter periplasmic adaptor subunit [Pseudomonadota bacterium]